MMLADELAGRSAVERATLKAQALTERWLLWSLGRSYVLARPPYRLTISEVKASPTKPGHPDCLECRAFLEVRIGNKWKYVPADPHGHYRFHNPPVKVPDGTYRDVVDDLTGETIQVPNFREDPVAALEQMLWDAVLLTAGKRGLATSDKSVPQAPFPPGMTTDTFYAAESDIQDDGFVRVDSATYSEVLDGSGTSENSTAVDDYVGQLYSAPSYLNYQSGIAWDTSTIPDAAVISSATVSLDGSADYSDTDFTVYGTAEFDWTPSGLGTADYRTQAQVQAFTPVVSWATSGYAAGYNDFTDIALPANINKTGWTVMFFWSSRFENGDTPTGNEYVRFENADEAGTTVDPKLVVEYTGPQTISPNGVASAVAVGQPTITVGPVTINPNGIASTAAVGQPTAIYGSLRAIMSGAVSIQPFSAGTCSLQPFSAGIASIQPISGGKVRIHESSH